MKCSSCRDGIGVEHPGKPARQNCLSCNRCVAVKAGGRWMSPAEVLLDTSHSNGWCPVQTPRDSLVHYILSQVMYREQERRDREVEFDEPDPSDIVMILWRDGQAIGFYTIKPQGTVVPHTLERYSMPTLDTAYVRTAHRGQGYGVEMLQHFTSCYAQQDVALSKPISPNMQRVVSKFLKENPMLREKVWEIDGTGGEGDRKLLWYSLKNGPKPSSDGVVSTQGR